MGFDLIVIFVIFFFQSKSVAINVDSYNSLVYQSPELTSLFGYNVKIYPNTTLPPSLIIGAPRSEGSSYVPQTGNVFSCSLQDTSSCSPLLLTGLNSPNQRVDDTGETGSYISERKDYMWLGVSIETSLNGRLITCAHRYVATGNGNNAFMHGQCYLFSSLHLNSTLIRPCRGCNSFTYQQCLAGLGLSINYDGSVLLIGIPGAKSFTGEVLYDTFDNCVSLFSPGNLDSIGEDALFGYSIARGRVINRNFEDIISSMPRYNDLYGGIAIFRNESGLIVDKLIIPGQHFGAYFGHSVITCDINGDGIDEIIVGLPNYSSDLFVEVGLVQIFIYDTLISGFINITIEHPDPMEYSRFGFSLAKIGNLNKIGGVEFAIGAPFGQNSGMVYLFTWSDIKSEPVLYQRLDGESISQLRNISSFGYSISPGYDVDGNNYEDLLIGAPLSSSVFLMRSFPVIYLLSDFVFNTEHIYTKNADSCEIEVNGAHVESICFQMNFSLSFNGNTTPNNANLSLDILIDKILFERSFHFRVYFLRDSLKTNQINIPNLIVERGLLKVVISEYIYVETNPIDLFTPVQFYASVSESSFRNSSDYFQSVKILGNANFFTTLEIRNVNCGSDNNCESDLIISGNIYYLQDLTQNTYYPEFIVNEVKLLMLNFTITNGKEEALSPILTLSLPPAVYFNRIIERNYRIHSETYFGNRSAQILIDLATSLVQEESISITILLALSPLVSQKHNFTINFHVKSVNHEDAHLLFDNVGHFFVQIKRSAILQLQSFLQTDQVYYNISNPLDLSMINSYNLQSIGNEVIHTYFLNNLKSSNVTQLRINFHWPLGNISANSFLLYLISLQYDDTSAVIRCDEQFLNYLNISSRKSMKVKRSVGSSTQYDLFKRDSLPLSNRIDCVSHPEFCVVFSCHIFNMPPSEGVRFTLKSRIFEPTLIQLSSTPVDWYITTEISLDIIEAGVDYITTIPESKKVYLVTHISPEEISLTYFVIQWYHIIPIILAVILPCGLFIVTFIALYLCGFFKIKKRGRQDIHAIPDEEYEEELTDFNVIPTTRDPI